MKEIAVAGIMSTPAIGIDGEVKIKGRLLLYQQLQQF